MKGIIASDIDRTLTNRQHVIPAEVIAHLHKCHDMGYQIVFLTGRPLSFARKALLDCGFPFHLGVQNGAEIIKMPGHEHTMKSLISKEEMLAIYDLLDYDDRDFIVYSGIAHGDHSYYNPANFSGSGKEYVDYFLNKSIVNWKPVDCLRSLNKEGFPLMRMFGTRKEMEDLKAKVEKELSVTCVVLNDVVQEGNCILMITAGDVDKGQSLKRLIAHNNWSGPVIGCGDDLNDVSLFEAVDTSIGMRNGHPELLKKATIIAEPAHEMGIIAALDKAIEMHD